MIERIHKKLLLSRLEEFPAVAILGPRQCGKTTLAKSLNGRYFDLEQPNERLRLDVEWETIARGEQLVVLDEAHEAPDIFPRLRGSIDNDRKRNGRFLLLGSVSPALNQNISDSLAGRLAIVELSPFIMNEIGPEHLDDLWLCGGFPDGGILKPRMFGAWQESYLSLLIERDLPAWGLPAKPRVTHRLVRMLAALHGQLMNASQLGSALSLDRKTVVNYCEFLEGAYLIRQLQPYHANLKKRLVKSSRIMWRDSGLFHQLQGIQDRDQLFAQPWVGHGWEAFVIEQTLSTLAAKGRKPQAYFFRTSDGHEIDLVLDWGREKWAIEIKLTSNPNQKMTDRLVKAADMIQADHRILVCRINDPIESQSVKITNLESWLGELAKI